MPDDKSYGPEDKVSYERSAIFIEGVVNEEKKARAEQEKEERKHRALQRKFDFLLVVFTGVTAIVGGAQGLFTWSALEVSRSQVAAAERANSLTRLAMKYAYVQARQSAIESSTDALEARTQSKAALDATIQASRTEQRAWIVVVGMHLLKEPSLGEQVVVIFSIQNSGKTPAYKVAATNHVGFFTSEPHVPNWDSVANHNRGVVFPNTMLRDLQADMGIATPEIVSDYTNHKTKLFVRTRVKYFDVFNASHWTELCAVHSFGETLDQFPGCLVQGKTDDETNNIRK